MKISSYKLRLLPALLLAAVLTALLFTAAAKSRKGARADWDRIARQRKGDYVFASAYQAIVQDSFGGGLTMLDYAQTLKPEDKAIAGHAEEVRAVILDLDSAGMDNAYRTIRDSWLSEPDDYNMGVFVANMGDKLGRFSDVVEVWQTLDSIYPTRTEPSVKLAEAYTRRYVYGQDTADYNRALAIYDRLEKESGKDVGLTSQKIRTLILRKDTTAVDAEVASMLEALPGESTPLLFAGLLNEQIGRDSMALVYYNRAAEADSTDGRVFNQLAEFYRGRGDSAAYRTEVFRSLESSNLDFEVKDRIMRGYLTELYADSTEWPRIEQLFSILRRMHPDEPDMYTLNGVFEISRDNVNAAREQFGYAVALDPSNSDRRSLLIQADLEADSLDALINDARPGLELNPGQLYFPIMMASAMARQRSYEPAIDLLKSVDLGEVENAVAASNLVTTLADIYQQSGQSDSAFATYDRAIALNPENYMAYNNVAYHMAEKGVDLPKADRYAGYAIAAEPENPTYLDTYAWVKFKQQEYKDAKTYIDKALNFTIDAAEARDAEARYDDGPLMAPVDSLSDAELDSLTSIDALGDTILYAETDSVEISERDLASYDKYDDDISAEILEHAGDIYYMCGEPDDALRFWKRALARKPEDSDLLERKVKAKAYLYK